MLNLLKLVTFKHIIFNSTINLIVLMFILLYNHFIKQNYKIVANHKFHDFHYNFN